MGRHAAKLALARHFGVRDLRQIEVKWGVFGQPLACHHTDCSPALSLCHCADLALAIACSPDHIVGIDVEICDPDRAGVIRSEMTAAELSSARGLPLDETTFLFLAWTMKEALSKALRCGLTARLQILETENIRPGEPPAEYTSFFKNFGQYKCHSWIVRPHVVSIVLPRKSDLGLDVGRLLKDE